MTLGTIASTIGKQPFRRIFSGIQCTGIPHMGNYVGAIKQWVTMQSLPEVERPDQVMYAVMDLHTMTAPSSANALRQNLFSTAASLLACGIDQDKCILFQQSEVKEHTELAWILGCLTTTGHLSRMTQWKAKAKKNLAGLGLFSYPVLMAADVLLYDTSHVPVGNDQLQHLELTNDITESFNHHFETSCLLPVEPIIGSAARLMSLRDPTVKMSKSDRSDAARINLTDEPDLIRKKIRRAVTDNIGGISFDPEARPGVSNLVTLFSAVSPELQTQDDVVRFASSMDTQQFKESLAEAVVDHIRPIQESFSQLTADRQHVLTVLAEGNERARALAAKKLAEIREVTGLSLR